MATTGSDFVYTTGSNPVLIGSGVQTLPYLGAMGRKEAMAVSQLDQVAGGSGAANASNSTVAGRLVFDPGLDVSVNPGTPPPVPENAGRPAALELPGETVIEFVALRFLTRTT